MTCRIRLSACGNREPNHYHSRRRSGCLSTGPFATERRYSRSSGRWPVAQLLLMCANQHSVTRWSGSLGALLPIMGSSFTWSRVIALRLVLVRGSPHWSRQLCVRSSLAATHPPSLARTARRTSGVTGSLRELTSAATNGRHAPRGSASGAGTRPAGGSFHRLRRLR